MPVFKVDTRWRSLGGEWDGEVLEERPSWGSFPGRSGPWKVRRIHVSTSESIWAEGYCLQRSRQNQEIANAYIWSWDDPGDF